MLKGHIVYASLSALHTGLSVNSSSASSVGQGISPPEFSACTSILRNLCTQRYRALLLSNSALQTRAWRGVDLAELTRPAGN